MAILWIFFPFCGLFWCFCGLFWTFCGSWFLPTEISCDYHIDTIHSLKLFKKNTKNSKYSQYSQNSQKKISQNLVNRGGKNFEKISKKIIFFLFCKIICFAHVGGKKSVNSVNIVNIFFSIFSFFLILWLISFTVL